MVVLLIVPPIPINYFLFKGEQAYMSKDMIIEVDFKDYAEIKASYTKEELLNIIRRIRADVEQTRNQLAIA